VSVIDAHDDSLIAENVKITGNRLVGVIHKNVDVEFDPMMGINAAWNEDTQNFMYSVTKTSESVLHLADNTTVFQTGASEGDDVLLNIGDMGSHSLGLDGVNVMSRERAVNSITLIDAAIDRVSMQQASLGAAQNRLEHHINNLTKETEALTEANSHIRDTDYQKEILEYAKMQILMQSNTAMLAQSNEMQRSSILGLLR
ncbi:MAG: flagellin, partial [Synergistaceae bacterium]|nr:flagellin [Synergistaceae bacterium]